MGWSDDDEDILVDLEAIDASVAAATARNNHADEEDDREDGHSVTERLVDDEAEADADEVDDGSQADDDKDEHKSAVTLEEKEETGNKAQTALLYMVHQMAAEVGHETGMQFSKQVTQSRTSLPFGHVVQHPLLVVSESLTDTLRFVCVFCRVDAEPSA